MLFVLTTLVLCLQSAPATADLPVITIDRDNIEITQSCELRVGVDRVADANGDGVVHITADGVTVRFRGDGLAGAARDAAADSFVGVGIKITGKRVTLDGAIVRGFKCGILATNADDLTLVNCDVSGNYRQTLRSTPTAEDGGDWLWPHKNDAREWVTNYGASICIERSRGVTVRGCRARDGQNGLILDRVSDGRVYDCDFSFLSGWGLAMWRCERNLISRNALDFCIRGYSHGVYNRGQDSAGILMFEQCNENIFIENSVTHGGDGFFAFGGREALGEQAPPGDPAQFDYYRRGNHANRLIGNDFSYAAAHGVELTFSFDNVIESNRIVGNAICGIWGGYSQDTLIARNKIESNGDAGYGLERGGVNIEHGRRNRIIANDFRKNAVGVHLWWDHDEAITRTRWARENKPLCVNNIVVNNRFVGDDVAIRLRTAKETFGYDNEFTDVKTVFEVSDDSDPLQAPTTQATSRFAFDAPVSEAKAIGETRPVGARAKLNGRERIIITAAGPYDWKSPLLLALGGDGGGHRYRLLGDGAVGEPAAIGNVEVARRDEGDQRIVTVRPKQAGGITPYELSVTIGDAKLSARGTIVGAIWDATAFAWKTDPRENVEKWRGEAAAGVAAKLASLRLPFGGGGPSRVAGAPQAWGDAKLPNDHFGVIAKTTLRMPAGRWRVIVTSDDGVRVLADGKTLVDDWTWHGPKTETAELSLDAERSVEWLVEYFELDGHSVLELAIESVP